MIKIAIVEDEYSERKVLENHCLRFGNETGETVMTDVFCDAITFLTSYKGNYDVIFFDIEMPMMNGVKAAEEVRKIDPFVIIVFVTNMQQYAIDGYKVSALDYILKPAEYFDILTLLKKICKILDMKDDSKILTTTVSGSVQRIPHKNLIYIEVARHRLTYHTELGDYENWGNLGDLEKKLSGESFSRCNACYLLNMRHIRSISGDEVTMSNGDILRVSHLKKKSFLSDIATYLGRVN